MQDQINLLIVDDNNDFLNSISTYLKEHYSGELNIVGLAHGGVAACTEAIDPAPQVVLLDLKMPDMHGFEVIPLIRRVYPHIKIIVTTLLPQEYDLFTIKIYEESAVLAGADAFLSKEALTNDLVPLLKSL